MGTHQNSLSGAVTFSKSLQARGLDIGESCGTQALLLAVPAAERTNMAPTTNVTVMGWGVTAARQRFQCESAAGHAHWITMSCPSP